MADVTKPIETLFSDESLKDLSEDFKTKATVMFENAVANQVASEKATLKEEYEGKLEEQRKEIEAELEEKVDSYLTYIAEEWMKDNELAIENGIQVEIAENFLKGMKDLFTESYVEIPENKVDVVSEMTEELAKKSESLDEQIDTNIELKKELVEMKKAHIVAGYIEPLADTQVDKLNDLVEMVDFEDEEQFEGRVKSIVETYFNKPLTEEEEKEMKKKKKEDGESDGEDDDMDDSDDKKKTDEGIMDAYVNALSLSANL